MIFLFVLPVLPFVLAPLLRRYWLWRGGRIDLDAPAATAASAADDGALPANLVAPALSGWKLRVFVAIMEHPIFQAILLPKLFADSGIYRFRRVVTTTPPVLHPVPAESLALARPPTDDDVAKLKSGTQYESERNAQACRVVSRRQAS